MIARIWHGWTTRANADAFQHLWLTEVVPAVEHRHIAGLMQIDVLRRDCGEEVEFTSLLLLDTIDAVRRYVGDDFTVAQIPADARALLLRSDEHVTHHDVLDRRCQPEHSRGRV